VRITIKALGIFLALFGVFLLSLFPFTLGSSIKTSDHRAGFISGLMAVLGIGFLFAGRHFFQADPSIEDPVPPASSFSHFLVRHRRELNMIVQIGFLLSLIRLVAACFGSDWPAPQATWFLLIGGLLLEYCGRKAANRTVTDNHDWMKVPQWIRRVLEWAPNAIGWVWAAAVIWAIYAQRHTSGVQVSPFVTRIVFDAMVSFIFALTALFFTYGELQA
jgi:hypothetical protein